LAEPGYNDTERLPDAETYALAEIAWIARTEAVEHLADLVLRRTTLAITRGMTAADLHKIAEVVAAEKGWSMQRCAAEVAVVTERLARINRQKL
jgi:glycerol-3-phosphate dehydrogenase